MNAAAVDPLRHPPAFRREGRGRKLARVLRRRRGLRAGTLQLLAIAAAVALGFLMPQISIGSDIPTARATEMLIAVGGSTIAFIGIVFSLLFLVVQFGTTAFTPRLNLFRDDPIVWRAFAFYTAVAVYSLTAALVIARDDHTPVTVPIVAFVAVLASIILYRQLQIGAYKSMQLASALTQVGRRGREVIDGLYVHTMPASDRTDPHDRASNAVSDERGQEIRWPYPAGVVQVIDVPRVLRTAEHAGAVVEFGVGSGETIAEGAAVARITGQANSELKREILKAVTVGEERTFEQDPALALRLLADIALRALSPAVNDPTTAVQALDTMDGLLRVLATRDLDVGHIAGSDGATRIKLLLPTWSDYLGVALDETIALPTLSPNVSRRILRLLDELEAITPPSRRPALDARRRQIDDPGRTPDLAAIEHHAAT